MSRLGRLARTISGVGFPPEEQGARSGDLPFLKVSDLADPGNSRGIRTAANWITRDQGRRLGVRVVPPGAIIFPKVGAALFGNARAIALLPCAIDNNMMAVAPRAGDPRFWYYALSAVDMGTLNLSGTIPFVSDGAVRDIDLPIDRPIDEQVKVARFLDDQVTRLEAIIALRRLEAVAIVGERQSIVRNVVSGASVAGTRRRSVVSWLDSVPDAWGEPRISQVARMGTGHTPSRSRSDLWLDAAIPWLTTGDVHEFRHDEIDALHETKLHISALGLANSAAVIHPAGTVALSRTASAGFSIVMGKPMATSQDFATWTPGEFLESSYLLWCLRDMRSDLMGRLAVGSTHKTIYFPDLMSIRIPLPSIGEQKLAAATIRAAVEVQRRRLMAIQRSIELLSEQKQSLITAAVTGEFDVSSADGSQVPVP